MVRQGNLERGDVHPRPILPRTQDSSYNDDMPAACVFSILTKFYVLELTREIGTIPGFINNVPARAWYTPSLTKLWHGIQKTLPITSSFSVNFNSARAIFSWKVNCFILAGTLVLVVMPKVLINHQRKVLFIHALTNVVWASDK